MKEVFPEWGSIRKDRECAGYFQVWSYEGNANKDAIPATEKEFEMAGFILKSRGIPLVLQPNTYSNQLGTVVGPYNAQTYLLNDSYVLLNELESPQATKERTDFDIIANIPKKTLAITSSTTLNLVNAARLLQLPLDETLKKAEIEYLRNNC